MSNAKTGIWSAIGAVLGGAAGVAAGNYAVKMRPSLRYYKGRGRGQATEDAMVMGGAAGAAVGAFLGGAIMGEDPPPPQLKR